VSVPAAPVVAHTTAQLDAVRTGLLAAAPGTDRPSRCAVVMTMGALHDGHVALMAAAREHVGQSGVVVVTVFVNPTQFGAGEDFDRYPRTLATDVAACRDAGVDAVYAPAVADMYRDPTGAEPVTVDPGPLGDELEGAARPGHFRGVLTVVAKLLQRTCADIAVFGEKDYQQLTLVRRMVDDLDLRTTVVGVPTVREPDGLAMSSRNRYLSPAERAAASAIPRGAAAAVAAARDGAGATGAAAAAQSVLAAEPGLQVDYVVTRGPLLGPAPATGSARLLLAVRAGGTRLIDNVALDLTGGSP
jgi:pantoate--beta-alanine ligase